MSPNISAVLSAPWLLLSPQNQQGYAQHSCTGLKKEKYSPISFSFVRERGMHLFICLFGIFTVQPRNEPGQVHCNWSYQAARIFILAFSKSKSEFSSPCFQATSEATPLTTGRLPSCILSTGPTSYSHAFLSAGPPRPQGGSQEMESSPPLMWALGDEPQKTVVSGTEAGFAGCVPPVASNSECLGTQDTPLQIGSSAHSFVLFFRTLFVYRWLFENTWGSSDKRKKTRIMSVSLSLLPQYPRLNSSFPGEWLCRSMLSWVNGLPDSISWVIPIQHPF